MITFEVAPLFSQTARRLEVRGRLPRARLPARPRQIQRVGAGDR